MTRRCRAERYNSRFKRLLDSKNMTVIELGRRAGITHCSVYAYLYGASMPALDIAVNIAKALGIPLDLLADILTDADAFVKQGKKEKERQIRVYNTRFKTLLDERGYTVAEFAKKAGISDSAVRSYMKAVNIPNIRQARDMARLLYVTIDELTDILLDDMAIYDQDVEDWVKETDARKGAMAK